MATTMKVALEDRSKFMKHFLEKYPRAGTVKVLLKQISYTLQETFPGKVDKILLPPERLSRFDFDVPVCLFLSSPIFRNHYISHRISLSTPESTLERELRDELASKIGDFAVECTNKAKADGDPEEEQNSFMGFFLVANVEVARELVCEGDDVKEEKVEAVVEEDGGDDDSEVHTCAICMEEISNEAADADLERVMAMPCSHVFHESCISRWLMKKMSCPCCRLEVVVTDDNNEDNGVVVAARNNSGNGGQRFDWSTILMAALEVITNPD